jgi:TetR/AcrR family transcriptional repressor of nem operon
LFIGFIFMARPREFDVETAVEKAMNAFWTHGYHGTSLPDLLSAMEITRGSLYKAFGSKKALFIRALNLYDDLHVKPAEVSLRDKTLSGEKRLAKVFRGAIDAVQNGDRRGCLLCNTSAGAASNDDEIAEIVGDQLDRLTQSFSIALADTKVWGSKTKKLRQAEARSLSLNYVGLRIMARGGQAVQELKTASQQTVKRFSGSMT